MHLFPAETMTITNSENLEGSKEVLFDLSLDDHNLVK